MNTRTQLVYALARHVGVPIVHREYKGWKAQKEWEAYRKSIGGPFWCGEVLWVRPGTRASDVLHEIAHYIETKTLNRDQLRRPNFGLTEEENETNLRREEVAGYIEDGLTAAINAASTEVATLRGV